MLEVRNLNAFYGAVQVLHDVNLSVSAGEIVGLVGANAAGKSTLMFTLAGLRTTYRGEVLLEGARRCLVGETQARSGDDVAQPATLDGREVALGDDGQALDHLARGLGGGDGGVGELTDLGVALHAEPSTTRPRAAPAKESWARRRFLRRQDAARRLPSTMSVLRCRPETCSA